MRYKTNRDDAGAALNEIFIKLLKALPDYNPELAVEPWVKTIAIRHLIDEYRKQLSRKEEELNAYEHFSDQSSEDSLLCKDILAIIQSLQEPTKSVVNLYIVDGFKHREIAEMLGISEGNSKWHLNKGRNQIKTALTLESERLERINEHR